MRRKSSRTGVDKPDEKIVEVKSKAEVIELFGTPKDFTEDELRGFWNAFRTPLVPIRRVPPKRRT